VLSIVEPMTSRGYALEVQTPFSTLILTGTKDIETRNYELPPYLADKDVYILESNGSDTVAGVSGIGDIIAAGQEGLRIVGRGGWVALFLLASLV
jgi:hypothetical protein